MNVSKRSPKPCYRTHRLRSFWTASSCKLRQRSNQLPNEKLITSYIEILKRHARGHRNTCASLYSIYGLLRNRQRSPFKVPLMKAPRTPTQSPRFSTGTVLFRFLKKRLHLSLSPTENTIYMYSRSNNHTRAHTPTKRVTHISAKH